MIDDIWQRDEPDSPCANICMIHPQAGICVGCYRTADEIDGWAEMPKGERLALRQSLPDRAKQLRTRRKRRI